MITGTKGLPPEDRLSQVFCLLEQAVSQHQREHRLGHRHDPGEDTGVMPPPDGNIHGIALDVPCRLRLCNGRRWLYRDPHDNLLPGGDAPEDAAGMVAEK